MISPATSSGGVFVAQAPASPPAMAAKLRMNPSANFVYLFHPRRWDVVEVDGEYVLVPILNEFRFEAGIGGVQHVRGHSEGDPTAAVAFEQARGAQIIDPKMRVQAFGRDVEGYARSYDGYRGRVHLSVWHRPYVLGDDHVIEHDTEGFNRWRRSLVLNGVVPTPDPTVIAAMRVRFERARSRYAEKDTIAGLANAEKYEARLQPLVNGAAVKPKLAVETPSPAPTPAPATPARDERIENIERSVASLADVVRNLAEAVRAFAPPVAPPAPPTDPKPLTTEAGDKPAADPKPPKRGAKPQD